MLCIRKTSDDPQFLFSVVNNSVQSHPLLLFFFFCGRDHRTQRGPRWPRPRGTRCFACEVKSLDAEEVFFYLITVLHSVYWEEMAIRAAVPTCCPPRVVTRSLGRHRETAAWGTATMKESPNTPPHTHTQTPRACQSQWRSASLGLLSRINSSIHGTGYFCVLFCVYISANPQNHPDPVYLPCFKSIWLHTFAHRGGVHIFPNPRTNGVLAVQI